MQYDFIYMSRNYPLIGTKPPNQPLIKPVRAKEEILINDFNSKALTLQTWAVHFITWKHTFLGEKKILKKDREKRGGKKGVWRALLYKRLTSHYFLRTIRNRAGFVCVPGSPLGLERERRSWTIFNLFSPTPRPCPRPPSANLPSHCPFFLKNTFYCKESTSSAGEQRPSLRLKGNNWALQWAGAPGGGGREREKKRDIEAERQRDRRCF